MCLLVWDDGVTLGGEVRLTGCQFKGIQWFLVRELYSLLKTEPQATIPEVIYTNLFTLHLRRIIPDDIVRLLVVLNPVVPVSHTLPLLQAVLSLILERCCVAMLCFGLSFQLDGMRQSSIALQVVVVFHSRMWFCLMLGGSRWTKWCHCFCVE